MFNSMFEWNKNTFLYTRQGRDGEEERDGEEGRGIEGGGGRNGEEGRDGEGREG